jgi:hypothetical protein
VVLNSKNEHEFPQGDAVTTPRRGVEKCSTFLREQPDTSAHTRVSHAT